RQPVAVGLEAPVEQPVGLALARRGHAADALRQALGDGVGLEHRLEAGGVFLFEAGADGIAAGGGGGGGCGGRGGGGHLSISCSSARAAGRQAAALRAGPCMRCSVACGAGKAGPWPGWTMSAMLTACSAWRTTVLIRIQFSRMRQSDSIAHTPLLELHSVSP